MPIYDSGGGSTLLAENGNQGTVNITEGDMCAMCSMSHIVVTRYFDGNLLQTITARDKVIETGLECRLQTVDRGAEKEASPLATQRRYATLLFHPR